MIDILKIKDEQLVASIHSTKMSGFEKNIEAEDSQMYRVGFI
jgi:hypothetical protein